MAPHANDADTSQEIVRLPAPERPSFSASPPRILIIGAGNRGHAYAEAIKTSTNGLLVSIIEPITQKRNLLGRKSIWGKREPKDGESFADWRDFVTWEVARREKQKNGEEVPEGVDAVFVCVQDQMHKEVVLGLAPLDLHIMCEKPLATSLQDCIDIYRSVVPKEGEQKKLFGIGHVLRYSPHNILLRKLLLEEKVIGEIMNVNHTEPVGWWHFTHSYVRGNWRKEKTSAPSLLAKSCHDMDILLWLLTSPPLGSSAAPHLPSTITSSGSLQYFKKSRKPPQAGTATNCLSCPIEQTCQFSAKDIYTGSKLKGIQQDHWVTIVLPEIEDIYAASGKEAGQKALLERLSEDYGRDMRTEEIEKKNWYGRCVYEADNDVCDNQTVTLTWEDDPITCLGAKTATLNMVAFTKKICQRYTHVYGVHGEVYADSSSITVQDFRTGEEKRYWPYVPEGGGHGDGDEGLARMFVLGVDKVKNEGWSVERAQKEFLGVSVEEVIRSHAACFAAEEARVGRKVVEFGDWWGGEVEARM